MSKSLPEIRPCDTASCNNWIPADVAPVAQRFVGIGHVGVHLCEDCTRRMQSYLVTPAARVALKAGERPARKSAKA